MLAFFLLALMVAPDAPSCASIGRVRYSSKATLPDGLLAEFRDPLIDRGGTLQRSDAAFDIDRSHPVRQFISAEQQGCSVVMRYDLVVLGDSQQRWARFDLVGNGWHLTQDASQPLSFRQ